VSLSADKHAALVHSAAMPEMIFPMFGNNAEAERKELKETYPDFVPSKRQVIPDSDRTTYEYWLSMEAYASSQKELAQNRIRFGLGDAQYGTDENGREFVSRRKGWRDGYNVTPGPTDSIYPEKG
jgi:hypothetical protein